MMIDIESIFARRKLNKIKERLRGGKVSGARKGQWVNGKPPFPYVYDPVNKKVEVDSDKAPVYRLVVERYLGSMSTQQIAVMLNKQGIPSPGGSQWHNNAIYRILVDEFHLGRVFYNKTRGSGHKRKGGKVVDLPRSQWITAEGNHERLKTQDEHDRILAKLVQNNRLQLPLRARTGAFPLSGILYCKKCGHRMNFCTKKLADGSVYHYARCMYNVPTGERCVQVGRKCDEEFYEALYTVIINPNANDMLRLDEQGQLVSEYKAEIDLLKLEIAKHEKALVKIKRAYEEDVYDLPEFSSRKKERDQAIKKAKDKIAEMEYLLAHTKESSPEELQAKVEDFKKRWHTCTTSQEQNRLLKTLIKCVWQDKNIANGT